MEKEKPSRETSPQPSDHKMYLGRPKGCSKKLLAALRTPHSCSSAIAQLDQAFVIFQVYQKTGRYMILDIDIRKHVEIAIPSHAELLAPKVNIPSYRISHG